MPKIKNNLFAQLFIIYTRYMLGGGFVFGLGYVLLLVWADWLWDEKRPNHCSMEKLLKRTHLKNNNQGFLNLA